MGELDTARADRRALARRVGFATQHAELHVPLRAWDVAALGLYAHGASWRALDGAERARVSEALEAFGVLGCAERAMPSLSGGEQQRVRLAALRVQAPLCSSSTSPRARKTSTAPRRSRPGCGSTARRAARSSRRSTIWARAAGFERVVVSVAGLLADGPPAEVATSAALREAYGRAPEVLCDAQGDLWVAPPLAQD